MISSSKNNEYSLGFRALLARSHTKSVDEISGLRLSLGLPSRPAAIRHTIEELISVARQYLDRLGTTCDVTVLLRDYCEKVDRFYAWLLAEVEVHLPLEVEDYRTCRKAIRRQHGRLSYEVMIGLWTQAGADPYQHLPRHLTAEQLEQLKTLPHRSPQQVDYIIACMDKDGIGDDHLRNVVHKFFSVSLVDGATD